MQLPLDIGYHHCRPSAALSALIQEKAEELERFYPRLIGCRVRVELPGTHHRRGKGAHFRIRVEVGVPGQRLVVARAPQQHRTLEDPFLAVNEAFHAMRRQLQEYARRQRGELKSRVGPPHARVARVYPEQGYGFLETAEGREIYFHRESVLGGGFDRLEAGMEVRFAEEPGEEGPQASTVQPVGEAGHHAFASPAR